MTILADIYKQAIEDAIQNEIACNGSVSDATRELIECNLTYIHNHARFGLNEIELGHWAMADDLLKEFFDRACVTPLAGDRVFVDAIGRRGRDGKLDGTSKLYDHALITEVRDGRAHICTQPYVPFVDLSSGVIAGHGLALSCSGGYFQSVPLEDLKPAFPVTGKFKFWGNGSRADGALQICRPVRAWSITSDLFY